MSGSNERARLESLAAFLPAFEAPGFEIGNWTPPRAEPDGVMAVGFFTLSEVGEAFVQVAAAHGWVEPGFDWGAWLGTEEARYLNEDARLVAAASPASWHTS